MKLGENIIAKSHDAAFFNVKNATVVGIDAPELRRGDALRTRVRTLSGFQKEAVVTSARTGQSWRLVSDEGPYLNGHDAAPCPLAFLTTFPAGSLVGKTDASSAVAAALLAIAALVGSSLFWRYGLRNYSGASA